MRRAAVLRRRPGAAGERARPVGVRPVGSRAGADHPGGGGGLDGSRGAGAGRAGVGGEQHGAPGRQRGRDRRGGDGGGCARHSRVRGRVPRRRAGGLRPVPGRRGSAWVGLRALSLCAPPVRSPPACGGPSRGGEDGRVADVLERRRPPQQRRPSSPAISSRRRPPERLGSPPLAASRPRARAHASARIVSSRPPAPPHRGLRCCGRRGEDQAEPRGRRPPSVSDEFVPRGSRQIRRSPARQRGPVVYGWRDLGCRAAGLRRPRRRARRSSLVVRVALRRRRRAPRAAVSSAPRRRRRRAAGGDPAPSRAARATRRRRSAASVVTAFLLSAHDVPPWSRSPRRPRDVPDSAVGVRFFGAGAGRPRERRGARDRPTSSSTPRADRVTAIFAQHMPIIDRASLGSATARSAPTSVTPGGHKGVSLPTTTTNRSTASTATSSASTRTA